MVHWFYSLMKYFALTLGSFSNQLHLLTDTLYQNSVSFYMQNFGNHLNFLQKLSFLHSETVDWLNITKVLRLPQLAQRCELGEMNPNKLVSNPKVLWAIRGDLSTFYKNSDTLLFLCREESKESKILACNFRLIAKM